MTEFIKNEMYTKKDIIQMINTWMGAEDGTRLTDKETKELREAMTKYPITKLIFNAGDFMNYVVCNGKAWCETHHPKGHKE